MFPSDFFETTIKIWIDNPETSIVQQQDNGLSIEFSLWDQKCLRIALFSVQSPEDIMIQCAEIFSLLNKCKDEILISVKKKIPFVQGICFRFEKETDSDIPHLEFKGWRYILSEWLGICDHNWYYGSLFLYVTLLYTDIKTTENVEVDIYKNGQNTLQDVATFLCDEKKLDGYAIGNIYHIHPIVKEQERLKIDATKRISDLCFFEGLKIAIHLVPYV
jgi:hypothetical protein